MRQLFPPPMCLRRPLGEAAPPTPNDIATLELWLPASVYTTGATDTWPNQALAPVHWTGTYSQATAANKPTYNASDANFNNQPSLSFTGAVAAQYLQQTIAGGPAAVTWIWIIKAAADPVAAQRGPWSTGTIISNHYPTGAFIYDDTGSTTRYNWDPTPNLASTMRMYAVRSQSGSWAATIDGSATFSSGTNTVGWTATQRIGSSGALTAGNTFVGQIAEVIVVRSIITAGEQATLLSYINNKYGKSYTAI